ncbi:MAG: 4Fe-4S binding protein [Bacteroidales bacterium]|nr:4Fe-4S binding protein [Bacteroidales bacterium]
MICRSDGSDGMKECRCSAPFADAFNRLDAAIDIEICVKCGLCIDACSYGAIRKRGLFKFKA